MNLLIGPTFIIAILIIASAKIILDQIEKSCKKETPEENLETIKDLKLEVRNLKNQLNQLNSKYEKTSKSNSRKINNLSQDVDEAVLLIMSQLEDLDNQVSRLEKPVFDKKNNKGNKK